MIILQQGTNRHLWNPKFPKKRVFKYKRFCAWQRTLSSLARFEWKNHPYYLVFHSSYTELFTKTAKHFCLLWTCLNLESDTKFNQRNKQQIIGQHKICIILYRYDAVSVTNDIAAKKKQSKQVSFPFPLEEKESWLYNYSHEEINLCLFYHQQMWLKGLDLLVIYHK